MGPEKRTLQAALLVLPLLWVAWNLVVNHLSGPHYLSRSDPEYVYLLNGLNAAMLQFDRIGHVDHPGTPFQLLTGVFIAVIYLTSGSGSMVEDVITSPEKYLFLSSFFLSLITAGLFYRISRMEFRRTNSLPAAILIPVTLLFYSVVTDLPSRYIPDRFLVIVLLGFSALGIRTLYHGYSMKRFIVYSALLMALGVVTKINFIPFLVLPLFFIKGWKGRFRYGGYLSLFAVILFLPARTKFNDFWRFARQVSTHDGLYGGGSEKMLDPAAFIHNLLLILKDNLAFGIILLLAVVILAILITKPSLRQEYDKETRVLSGFFLVALMLSFIVAKHYKNYYMIPALVTSGFALHAVRESAWRKGLGRYFNAFFISGGALMILLNGLYLLPGYHARVDRKVREQLAERALAQHIHTGAYFLVEPTWMAGPTPVNGLVYGISYIAHRHYFYNNYERIYPHVLTFEGMDRPLRFFRLLDASNESILKSGKDIFLLSSPGRNAGLIVNYLDSCAAASGVGLATDTVFTDPNIGYDLLRIRNTTGWATVEETHYGFETATENSLLDDRGKLPLAGPFRQVKGSAGPGSHALALDGTINRTPPYTLSDIRKGDLIEWSIKRGRGSSPAEGALVASYLTAGGESRVTEASERLSAVHPRWELVRLTMTVEEQPIDSMITCHYQYRGEGIQVVDDFSVRHMTVK